MSGRGVRVALLGLEDDALARTAAALPTEPVHWHVDVARRPGDGPCRRRGRASSGPRLGRRRPCRGGGGGPFTGSDPEAWRRVIEVNLVGSAITVRTFLPQLLRTRGHYQQIASLASIGAAPVMSAYCASKAGVESFSHALRAEPAPHRVSVGIAYPDWIDTDLIRDAGQHRVLRELRARMPPPARRTYAPEYVARLVVGALERRHLPYLCRACSGVSRRCEAVCRGWSRCRHAGS
ncbi:SDR family NAD(P)-dependent oxidoreductase [Streptomyces sp. NPDC088726]|uniref:SDR family NAD(P)-dependent oxidoreductase n=1 Tax=Streptomyces sp. NPDC088726 TaxID=3365874 RepID=UPI00380BE082